MKKITKITSLSSEIYQEYSVINSIEIDEVELGKGNFGIVYLGIRINEKKAPQNQVIKIFKDVNGSAEKGYATIQELQKKIKFEVQKLSGENKDFEVEYPALLGCPQFSFKGSMNGKDVFGYSANNLNDLGFIEFDKILTVDEELIKYQQLKIASKLVICYQIANGFDLLRKFQYIHADFKPEALFVNLEKLQCAIIDFDSGAVMQTENNKPTTWGTKQTWLAQEIVDQITIGEMKRKNANDLIPVQVDLWSDTWSVAVCIHCLIFTLHPFYFLTEITKRSIEEFVDSKAKFPEFPNGLKYFNKQKLPLFNKYCSSFKTHLPKSIQEKFSNSFTSGCFNPSRRITYAQWKTVLQSIQKPPKILSFKSDKKLILDKTSVTFNWKIEDDATVFLNNINVTGKTKFQIVIRKDTEFELKVSNPFGNASKKIKIETSKDKPTIKSFRSNLTNNYVGTNKDIMLTWDISNYETIEIVGVADVTNKNRFTINAPKKDTTLTIKATTFFGQISTKKINLTVNRKPPQIDDFSTSNNTILDIKKPAILKWQIKGAENIFIDNGIGDVTNKNSVEVIPRVDSVYTIIATSYFGIISRKQVRVQVSKAPPKIKKFESNKQLVTKVEDVILYWEAENADKIFINKGIGDVTNSKTASYKITEGDTTFTLTAISYFGVKSTSTITIQTLKVPPTIKSFYSSKNIVSDSKPIKLSWNIADANSIVIDNGVGDVSKLRSVEISVKNDVTYTIYAKSLFGALSTRQVRINISKRPPRILLFRTSTPILFRGQSTTLTWQVEQPYEVFIDNDIGKVEASGKIEISPTTDKTYTLVAKNYFGYESRSHVYVKIISKPELKPISTKLKPIPKLNKINFK